MINIKTIFSAIIVSASLFLPQQTNAQAPEKMSYQTIVRNASNNLVVSTAIGMRISVLQTTAEGTAVYVETHAPTTNANGLVSVEIGGGTPITGTFAAINWANGPYFVKTEIDPLGGSTYSITGVSQLLAVPYALYAKTAKVAETAGKSYTQTERDLLTPYAGLMIYNTSTNKPNYFNGTEWLNFDGTTASALKIGDSFEGGKIAYIFHPGNPGYVEGETHGIIAASNDHTALLKWGHIYFPTALGAFGLEFGTGLNNTITIVNSGVALENSGAVYSYNLTLNGYSDWYLPSLAELQILYSNRELIGNFSSDNYYWSSSELDDAHAYALFFGFDNMIQEVHFKSFDYKVRAIRNF